MQLDAIVSNIIVSLLVGSVSAWIAGMLGVRYGLERAKREHTFERQLAWREKTVRALYRFATAARDLANGIAFATPEEVPKLVQELESVGQELDGLLQESLLYAEREVVTGLAEEREYLEHLMVKIKDKDERSAPRTISADASAAIKSLRKLAFSLSQSVRKQLDLDSVDMDDTKSERQRIIEPD